MEQTLFAGSANARLAEAIAAELGTSQGALDIDRFPDGELHVEIKQSVRGHDVYLIQPTSPPVERNLLELLMLADAAHRAGAARLTAVIPYLGYARQDRRVLGREAVGARLIAELLAAGGLLQRIVAVDVHSPAIEGFFGVPLEHLSVVPLLVESVRNYVTENCVIVAPDLGAAKLAERFARPLGLPVAIVHKSRLSGSEVSVQRVTGDILGRTPIIVDDMISTGGTVEAAIEVLLSGGCKPEITVVASHGLFVGPALKRLSVGPIKRIVITDSVRTPEGLELPLEVVSLAPLLARAVDCLHNDRSLGDLLARA